MNLPLLPGIHNEAAHQAIANEYVQDISNHNLTMAAVVPPVEVFKTNPFNGDFNPGTEPGRKIFIEKTRGLDESDRLDLTKASSTQIQLYFKAREEHLGEIGCAIPIEFNADGSVKTKANMLTQSYRIKLSDAQRVGHETFSTALAPTDAIPAAPFALRALDPANNADDKKTFYKRVHSNVVATIIKNGLTVTGWEDLMLQKDLFMFTNADGDVEYDGGTMLSIIYSQIQPSTTVGLDSLLGDIENAKLKDYQNDVDKMLKMVEANYKILKLNGEAPKKYLKLILEALATGPNAKFNGFIERINDDVESGIGVNKDITAEDLIIAARLKFNNMDKKGEWDKVDPREAQMLALVTEVQELRKSRQQQTKPAAALATQGTTDTPADVVPGTRVEKWCVTFDGDHQKTVKGKKYWWCPHHELAGKWKGLYVLHSPDQHKGKTYTQPAGKPADKPRYARSSQA